MTRLQQFYREKVVPELKQKFGHTNDLAVPRLQKIVISMGVGMRRPDVTVDESTVLLVDVAVLSRDSKALFSSTKVTDEVFRLFRVATMSGVTSALAASTL